MACGLNHRAAPFIITSITRKGKKELEERAIKEEITVFGNPVSEGTAHRHHQTLVVQRESLVNVKTEVLVVHSTMLLSGEAS